MQFSKVFKLSRHELTAVFCGIRRGCEWQNDDGSLTIIGSARIALSDAASPCGKMIDIKGQIPCRDSLTDGLTYRFYGQTKTHPKYGDQFCFESFVVEAPVGQEAVCAYLSQCRGIGPKAAFAMWQKWGEDAVETLRERPEEVVPLIRGFTVEKAIAASDLLKSWERTERSKIGLLGLLKGRGFPRNITDKLIDLYGVEAATVVHRNPYLLMKFKGVGFLKADKMYLDLGHNPARLKRQALCAWHAIAKSGEGHTWFPFAAVRDGLRASISSATVDVERAMQLAVRAGLLSETFHNGQRWVAERRKADDEQRIAWLIEEARAELESNAAPLLWEHVASAIGGITDHQRDNAQLATSGFIGVLAGRPGTGKTYTVARMVAMLQTMVGEWNIAIAAPTGKAAVRVTAAMEAVGLGLRAKTIHSLLGFGTLGSDFEHHRGNPLPHTFIIVDESSMIDTALMRALLDARGEGTHVLFVGDPNQLAPVGHGAPLRDLIMADVPHGTLIEIQRNSGRIVKACGEIIDRRRLTPSAKLDVAAGENLLLIERDTADVQIDTLTAVMQNYQRKFAADALVDEDGPADPIWDVQIVVAVNAKSKLGRKPLNKVLQQLLNADGRCVAGNPFRVGDKIINSKNGEYRLVAPMDDDDSELDPKSANGEAEKAYVANGEQAEVLDVGPTKIIARLTSPDRTILIPRSAGRADGDEGGPGDDSGSGDSEEGTGSGCAWELGYAISCHKSQGSEWPVVVVMLDDYSGAKMVQSRQWLYTGISRAKRLCLMIGKQTTANEACGRDALFKRKTFLKEQVVTLRHVAERGDAGDEVLDSVIAWTDSMVERILEGVC